MFFTHVIPSGKGYFHLSTKSDYEGNYLSSQDESSLKTSVFLKSLTKLIEIWAAKFALPEIRCVYRGSLFLNWHKFTILKSLVKGFALFLWVDHRLIQL